MNENIEREIQKKGLTAPRITPQMIDEAIAAEYITTADKAFPGYVMRAPQLGLLTICVLVLNNGFTVVGTSACASPENFDAEIGAKIAREDAKRQIWPLEGYALRNKLVRGDPA